MEEIRTDSKPQIGCLVLAAGASRRLGSPKQLLIYDGKTLLRRAAETAVDAGFEPVIVVLGSEIERSNSEISGLDVKIHINKDWELGMSSSIKSGLEHLLKIQPEIDGILISLCDQPKITSKHLDLFVKKFKVTKASIIAAHYEGVAGVPTLFSKECINDLLKIEGDKGAKDFIRGDKFTVETIELPEAAFDIDTPGDAGI